MWWRKDKQWNGAKSAEPVNTSYRLHSHIHKKKFLKETEKLGDKESKLEVRKKENTGKEGEKILDR